MKVNQSVTFDVRAYGGMDADKMREALSQVPPGIGAKIVISHYSGDRPWESGGYTVKLEWTEER